MTSGILVYWKVSPSSVALTLSGKNVCQTLYSKSRLIYLKVLTAVTGRLVLTVEDRDYRTNPP